MILNWEFFWGGRQNEIIGEHNADTNPTFQDDAAKAAVDHSLTNGSNVRIAAVFPIMDFDLIDQIGVAFHSCPESSPRVLVPSCPIFEAISLANISAKWAGPASPKAPSA